MGNGMLYLTSTTLKTAKHRKCHDGQCLHWRVTVRGFRSRAPRVAEDGCRRNTVLGERLEEVLPDRWANSLEYREVITGQRDPAAERRQSKNLMFREEGRPECPRSEQRWHNEGRSTKSWEGLEDHVCNGFGDSSGNRHTHFRLLRILTDLWGTHPNVTTTAHTLRRYGDLGPLSHDRPRGGNRVLPRNTVRAIAPPQIKTKDCEQQFRWVRRLLQSVGRKRTAEQLCCSVIFGECRDQPCHFTPMNTTTSFLRMHLEETV